MDVGSSEELCSLSMCGQLRPILNQTLTHTHQFSKSFILGVIWYKMLVWLDGFIHWTSLFTIISVTESSGT